MLGGEVHGLLGCRITDKQPLDALMRRKLGEFLPHLGLRQDRIDFAIELIDHVGAVARRDCRQPGIRDRFTGAHSAGSRGVCQVTGRCLHEPEGARRRDLLDERLLGDALVEVGADDRRKLFAFARDLLNSDYAGHRLTFQLFAQAPPFAQSAAVYRNFDWNGPLSFVHA